MFCCSELPPGSVAAATVRQRTDSHHGGKKTSFLLLLLWIWFKLLHRSPFELRFGFGAQNRCRRRRRIQPRRRIDALIIIPNLDCQQLSGWRRSSVAEGRQIRTSFCWWVSCTQQGIRAELWITLIRARIMNCGQITQVNGWWEKFACCVCRTFVPGGFHLVQQDICPLRPEMILYSTCCRKSERPLPYCYIG